MSETGTRVRYQNGSVQLDKRSNTWVFRWREDGKRKTARLGTLAEVPTKAKAMRVAERHRLAVNCHSFPNMGLTFEAVARRYMAERMPTRYTTSLGYRNNLEKHAIPKWGSVRLPDMKAIDLDRWFHILPLAAKTKAHIRSVMRQVFEYAMLCELYDAQRNPMDLIRLKGSTKRGRKPIILSPDDFHRMLRYISAEPYKTMVIVALCLGVRRSELIALKWSDFDWLNNTVMIQRSMVDTRTGEVKTEYSARPLPLDPALVALLRKWQGQTDFNAESDWVWASPYQAGALPYYPNWIQREYITKAGIRAGLGPNVGWHTLRHTYRAWLDKTGAALGVQKDLMRHADIKTTMNVYGKAIAEPMREANSEVVRLVIQ